MIKGILFDIDGTLLDSNDAHANSWIDTFKEFKMNEIEFESVRRAIGMGADNLLPAVAGIEEDSKLGEQLSKCRAKIFKEKYLPLLKPFPRARELVQEVKSLGFKVVVATSASEEDLKGLLKRAKLDDLFEEKTNSDDVDNSKPDPDIIIAAMKKIGVKPGEAIMIGDTPYDIAAAGRAAVKSIGFTCGGWSADSLKDAEEIYKGPWDLLDHLKSSMISKGRYNVHLFHKDSEAST